MPDDPRLILHQIAALAATGIMSVAPAAATLQAAEQMYWQAHQDLYATLLATLQAGSPWPFPPAPTPPVAPVTPVPAPVPAAPVAPATPPVVAAAAAAVNAFLGKAI